ncbi:MAG: cell division/cell wall cluster transcriptional repressor MraZ [Ilumatobacteraceae bacterium]
MQFVGKQERQLDDKGRIALPAPYRSRLGDSCYLLKGEDKCIEVHPMDKFDALAEEMMAAEQRGEVHRHRRRTLAGSAQLVAVDKQGRVKISDDLLTFAGIPGESLVVVAGNFDRLEIWEPERRRRVEAAGDEELGGDDDLDQHARPATAGTAP